MEWSATSSSPAPTTSRSSDRKPGPCSLWGPPSCSASSRSAAFSWPSLHFGRPLELLRNLLRELGDAAQRTHKGHDLRHRAPESDLPAQHEPLEVPLTFPELHPRVVGPFELEVRRDVRRDLMDHHLAALNVNQKRGFAIGAREDDFRRDRRGLLPPLRIRVEATRDFVEECLGEVLHHGRRSRGPEVGPQEKGSDGASRPRPRRERFYGPRSLRGRAWVAKPGQRRGTQDPFPKGFPGSNPGPRIVLPVKSDSPLGLRPAIPWGSSPLTRASSWSCA